MRRILLNIHWFLATQLGLDVQVFFRSASGLPAFIRDYLLFRKQFKGKVQTKPCLHDRFDKAGSGSNEYFIQDLLVSQRVFASAPEKHVDIGSRVDGFVAQVASFRPIDVLDVRPLDIGFSNISFTQADVMDRESLGKLGAGYCDSLSCLHALEHFGLGRYGDPIDPSGWKKGLCNLAYLLRVGGTLYLCVPTGKERVEFNANWVFDPRKIVAHGSSQGLRLKRLTAIQSGQNPADLTVGSQSLDQLSREDYTLCLFQFELHPTENS